MSVPDPESPASSVSSPPLPLPSPGFWTKAGKSLSFSILAFSICPRPDGCLRFGPLMFLFCFVLLSPPAFACMEPLGMESGEVSAQQILASSQYNSNWSPERSRLNYHENGWTPSDDTIREWIQVSPPLPPGADLRTFPPRLGAGDARKGGRHPLCTNICLRSTLESGPAPRPRNQGF